MIKLFFCLLFLCLLTGCSLLDPLPEGTPPEGAIVRNVPVEDFNIPSAVNYMTTSLSIYLLTHPLEKNQLAIDADAATLPHARSVLEEISRVTGIREQAAPGGQILKTRSNGKEWIFSLSINGKQLWKEQLKLSLVQSKAVSNH